jgi:hypothetical protein
MGWPFSRKKRIPKVPFPDGKTLDDKELKFPMKAPPSEKLLKPEAVKEAVGFDKLMNFPEEIKAPPKLEVNVPQLQMEEPMSESTFEISKQGSEDLYVKVEVYQRILGEMQIMDKRLSDLNEINKNLDKSEYNEKNSFNKLKRLMKSLHDKLLQIDRTIYKA